MSDDKAPSPAPAVAPPAPQKPTAPAKPAATRTAAVICDEHADAYNALTAMLDDPAADPKKLHDQHYVVDGLWKELQAARAAEAEAKAKTRA